MVKKRVICIECDSEYILEYGLGCVSDEPKYCVFCQEEVEVEDVSEDE